MTLLLKKLVELVSLLHSDTGARSIAVGIACGFILGISPLLSIQGLIVILCLLIFNIQLGAAILSSFVFKLIFYILAPLAHSVGSRVLEAPQLRSIFTTLYETPIIPYLKFYNSINMGTLIIGILLFPIIYIISKYIIEKYRTTILAWLKSSPAWKYLKKSKLFLWYFKFRKLKEKF